jgi:hypothetical protein
MTKKMYYTETEAADLLGCSVEALADHVESGKIRVFKDGMQNVYTAKEVDALASELGLTGSAGDTDTFDLSPAEDAGETDPFASLASEDTGELELAPEEPLVAETPEPITLADDTAELDIIELAPEAEEISLEPAGLDGSSINLADLTDAPATEAPKKDDTVLSADGVSIFDQADFEVEGADPMAKTQMAPSLQDQISMDSVGGGSGLLDLTRESDDTSLGAEILEHIDADSAETPPMDGLLGDDLGELTSSATALSAPVPQQAPEPTFVEIEDPIAGLFGGIAIGCGILLLVIAAISLAKMLDLMPSFVEWITQNLIVMIIAPIVIIAMSAAISFMMSKNAAARQAAIRRAG